MTGITVCPLSRLAATIQATGARHVVTLINEGTAVPVSAERDGIEHLFLGFNDICEPAEGMICPAETHIVDLLAFMSRWDRASPVVVHCFAGISRSTAAAFTCICALRPDLDEQLIARRLRQRSPEATPNARMVALADEVLRRDGRMVRAIAGIGRGADAFEGSIFTLGVDE